jgi:hypothetical protein
MEDALMASVWELWYMMYTSILFKAQKTFTVQDLLQESCLITD